MLLMAYLSACLGLVTASRRWGISFVLMSAPAALRTHFVAKRRRNAGKPLGLVPCVGSFLTGLGLMAFTFLLPLMAALFVATAISVLMAIDAGDGGIRILSTVNPFSLVVGVIYFVVLFWILVNAWRIRDD